MAIAHKEITWERDFDAALNHSGGKHVILDFTAAPM